MYPQNSSLPEDVTVFGDKDLCVTGQGPERVPEEEVKKLNSEEFSRLVSKGTWKDLFRRKKYTQKGMQVFRGGDTLFCGHGTI